MEKIYYATTNNRKVERLKECFLSVGLNPDSIVKEPIDLPEPRSYDIREIARQKAISAYDQLYEPCIVQDSGFFIYSLNGFPRTFVNFTLETIGVDGILKLMKGIDNRACRFLHCLVYNDGTSIKRFESVSLGTLAEEPIGPPPERPLHQIFIPDGQTKTLAQMTPQEKARWYKKRSFQDDALQFAQWLAEKSS